MIQLTSRSGMKLTLGGLPFMLTQIESKITDPKERVIYEKYKGSLPFDVLGFAKALGISVLESTELGLRISGFIRMGKDGKTAICVNEFDSGPRKRFTIAHELGHYFCHKDKLEEGIIDGVGLHRDGDRNDMEFEANDFAAELLMPEATFRALWILTENYSIAKLSSLFNVSESALMTRAKLLQLVELREGFFA